MSNEFRRGGNSDKIGRENNYWKLIQVIKKRGREGD